MDDGQRLNQTRTLAFGVFLTLSGIQKLIRKDPYRSIEEQAWDNVAEEAKKGLYQSFGPWPQIPPR